MRPLKDYVSYLAITSVVIFGYVNASPLWVDIGYAKGGIFRQEIPLLLAGLTILYFGKLKSHIDKYLLPVTPFLLAYLSFDLFYNYLGRAPRLSDLRSLQEVFLFSPMIGAGILLIPLAALTSLLLLAIRVAKSYSRRDFSRLLIYKGITVAGLALLFSTGIYRHYHKAWFHYVPQSQKATIRHNGRFSSFLFYSWRERENRKRLLTYASSDVNVSNTLYPGQPQRKTNIHIIFLESFLDPRMIEGIRFNRSPLAKELHRLIGEKGFSLVRSPTYGGSTAQPEFELLSGIKAMAKVETVEFNVMNGNETHGFVNRLKENGYHTLGTIATGFGYFNSKQAYRSLGIPDLIYLGERGIKRPGDRRLFDGDLFDFNLQRIRKLVDQGKTPIFNYVLGMYGHMPYERNTALRPDLIETNLDDWKIQRIANQFYYRTKALGIYLKELLAIDPDSIIYVTSDHLPPVFNAEVRYTRDRYTNIALLFNAGTLMDISGKHYYEIPWVLWDILTQKANWRPVQIREAGYLSVNKANKPVCADPPACSAGQATRQRPVTMEELYFKTLYESL